MYIVTGVYDQKDGGCSTSGIIQGWPGQASEQPDPVESVPPHCRSFGLDDL